MHPERQILLGRPHPLIAIEMTTFLEAHGFRSVKMEDMAGLRTLQGQRFTGAFISTAVNRDADRSFREIFVAIREIFPRLPLAFSTLMGWEPATRAIALHLAGLPAPELLEISAETRSDPRLGATDVVPVIRKSDLSSTATTRLLADILDRHFRPAG